MFEIILLIILILALVVLNIFWIYQFYYNHSQDKIGYLPSLSGKINKTLLEIIKKYRPDTENYNFVELGAGLANISAFVGKNLKFKSVQAVELDLITIWIAGIFTKFSGSKLQLIQKNVFDYQIPESSILYCYLGDRIINKMHLEGRFKGHLVISTTFSLNQIKPTEVVELKNFYGRIFVYDFRK